MKDNKAEDEDAHRIGVRIPADLYPRLCERAKKNRRSINDELLVMLDDHLSSLEIRVKEDNQVDRTRKASNA